MVPDSVTNSVLEGGRHDQHLAGRGFLWKHDREPAYISDQRGDECDYGCPQHKCGQHPGCGMDGHPTASDRQRFAGRRRLGKSFVVTGGAGTILTSTNTTNWTVRSVTSAFLSGVTAFPGGLVAVGDLGAIVTSSDGVQWTPRNSGTTNWLYRVHYFGGKLIAVGENGYIVTSQDGMTWSRQASGTTLWLNDVAYIDDTYFIVGAQGTVLASTDAINWTNIGTISQKTLYGTAAHNGQLGGGRHRRNHSAISSRAHQRAGENLWFLTGIESKLVSFLGSARPAVHSGPVCGFAVVVSRP